MSRTTRRRASSCSERVRRVARRASETTATSASAKLATASANVVRIRRTTEDRGLYSERQGSANERCLRGKTDGDREVSSRLPLARLQGPARRRLTKRAIGEAPPSPGGPAI